MNNFKLEFLNKLILSEYEEKRTISKKLNKYASKVVDLEKVFYQHFQPNNKNNIMNFHSPLMNINLKVLLIT